MGWGDEDKVVDAGAPVAPSAVSWGGNDKPVTKVGALENLGRQFVAGGGDVLTALQKLGDLGNKLIPTPGLIPAGAHDDITLGTLGKQAQESQALQPNEVAADLVSRIAGGAGRALPNLAAAIGTGGESTLAGLVPGAVRSVPVLGRVLGGIAAGAPTAGALTGIQSANLPDTMSTGDKLAETGKNLGLNLAMAGLPVAVGESQLLRAGTGAGIGYGTSAATSAIQGQPQDQANNAVGAIMGALLSQHGGEVPAGIDPHLAAYVASAPKPVTPSAPAAPLALPAGADFTSQARVVRPGEQPVGPNGTVAVTPAGEAFTPAQGQAQVADVLQNALRAVHGGLPAPVVNVDSAGTAMTSADQNAKAIEAQNVAQQMLDTIKTKRDLGITPDIERTQAVKWGQQDQQVKAEQAKQDAAASAPVVSGGLRAAKVLADGPTYPAAPYDMTPDQIATHSQAVEAHGRNVEDAILGDQADAWRKAHRQSNSSNDARANAGLQKVSDIEAALPQDQIDQLYGVGETNDANDLLDDYKSIHEDVDLADTPQQASVVLSRLLPKLGGTEGRDPANWKRDQQVAYAGMRSLADKIQAEGWDSSEIQKRALNTAAARYGDMNDAGFMLQRFLKPRSASVDQARIAQSNTAKAVQAHALADVDKQIALREAQNKPARGRNALPDEGVDDALTFLAKKGGLDRRAFISEGIDPKDARLPENNTRGGASRPLFRAVDKGGMSLDRAAETLWQHGYLPEQDNNAALDLIQSGVVQGDNHYSIYRQDQGDLMALEQHRRDIADYNTDFSDVPFSRRPVDRTGGKTRAEFLGNPKITKDENASGLQPRALRTVASEPSESFMGGRYQAKFSPDGAVVMDGDKPIASYNFGDTLAVAKPYRRKGIATELVSEWRSRYPDSPVASHRTKAAQKVQEAAYERLTGQRDPSFSFAGERAQTADRSALAQAQQMEAVGRDSVPDREGNVPGSEADTHTATGWSRGKDGKWRFEIDDSKASIKPLAEWADNSKYPHRMPDVGQVLDHPELLKAYPQLADVGVRSDTDLGTSIGAYNPARNVIEIRNPADYPETGPKSLKSVLLHEIQHAIQNHEGFARGASVSEFKEPRTSERDQLNGRIKAINKLLLESSRDGNKARYDQLLSERSKVVRQLDEKGLRNEVDIHEAAHKDYKRVAGEAEARNTQKRMDLSAADRRATPPSETEDVPRSQQIVKFGREPSMDEGETHATQQDRAATDKISKQLSDHIGKPVSLVPANELPHALRRALEAFDGVVGGKTTVFENNTPQSADFQGVTMRDGQRFVNVTSDVPLLQVAVHEFGHDLRKDRPDLWKELGDHMEQNGDIDAYLAQLKKNAKAGGFDPESVSRGEAHDELVSDAMGDAMVDPEFLDRLAKSNPTLFAKVAAYFKQALDRILSRLKDMGSNKYVRDVQAFRDKLEDVLTRYATERSGGPRVASGDDLAMSRRSEPDPQTQTNPADNRIAFSRRPADDATRVQDDLPPRRPGESQSDWMARVYRKNGAEIKQALALAKMQQKLGRYQIRAMTAHNARAMEIADAAMRAASKAIDKTPRVINLASIHQGETGKHIDDPDFRKFWNVAKEGYAERAAEMEKLEPGSTASFFDNYMAHLYEDSSKATKWYQSVMGKKPLEGDKSFFKERTHATLKDAMATGLRPITYNPVDWTLLKMGQMDKYIGMLRLKKDLNERGWIMKLAAGQKPPEGWARVDDPAFQISGGLNGSYALPELIAKDLNNYTAPGLSKYGAWRGLRAIQNGLVSASLGWSGFHAGFTSIDNAVTHGAVGLQRLAGGDIHGGLKALVMAVPTMVTSPFEGGKLNRQWTGQADTDPNTAAILDALEQGGARMKMGNASAEYNNALPKVLRTIRELQAPGALSDRIAEAKGRAASRGPLENAGAAAKGLAKGVGNTFSALGEVGSFLIHHVLVPNQKMAARVTLLKFELDRAAGQMAKAGYDVKPGEYAKIVDLMHPDVLKQLASDVVDKVDFRLGQMAYDNYFYPKIAREVAQALVMAPGWQAGALQTMTGGIHDIPRAVKPEKLVNTLDKAGKITDAHRGRFTNNTANLLMLMLMVGGAGAALQYALTGDKPDSMKDLVAPRTGRKNADGSDERLVLPSYLKDHWEFFHHPLEMASHKLNPSWRVLSDLAHNQDFFGTEIRNPNDSELQQAGEVAKYLLKSLTPFSVSNTQKAMDNRASPGQMAAGFVGVTNAPASITRTDFQSYVAKKAADSMPQGARTQAQKADSDRRHQLEDAIRNGEKPDMNDLTEKQQQNVEKAARMEVPVIRFKRLSIMDKLFAYDLATPKERDQYDLRNLIVNSHWQRAVMNLDASDRQQVIDKIQRLGSDNE